MQIRNPVHNRDFGASVGVGAMGHFRYFCDHLGLRGDVRYLRTFGGSDEEFDEFGKFSYWRGTAGLFVRF